MHIRNITRQNSTVEGVVLPLSIHKQISLRQKLLLLLHTLFSLFLYNTSGCRTDTKMQIIIIIIMQIKDYWVGYRDGIRHLFLKKPSYVYHLIAAFSNLHG